MVKKLFALSMMLVLLCGCGVDLYAGQRPKANPDEQWVSEDPQMYFTWDDAEGHWGEITVDGVTTKVRVLFDYGCGVAIDEYTGSLSSENRLFNGQCKFGKNKLVITVTKDWTNFFAGELPTITLVRQVRQEDGSFAPAE